MEDEEYYFSNLPDEPILALRKVCEEFSKFNQNISSREMEEHFSEYVDFGGLLLALIETYKLPLRPIKLSSNKSENIGDIINLFDSALKLTDKKLSQLALEEAKSRYTIRLGKTFYYEFSDGDLKRLQELINELRDLIKTTAELENGHRDRLLKRLEKLQAELHKRVPNLDRFWGLIGDAGVVLGKLGRDAKPFVDRIREIAELVWRTQAAIEGLPSNMPQPLLPPPKEENSN